MDQKCKPKELQPGKCRTINLANQFKNSKLNMQMYEKCVLNSRCCPPVKVSHMQSKYGNVYNKNVPVKSKRVLTVNPYYPHGKLMYLVKAAFLVGAAYFSYRQGVWGDQQDATECTRRWLEYLRSINRRRPPDFDQSGKVIMAESTESMVAPLYLMYKGIITTCFSGVVKLPLIAKCAYVDYLLAQERHQAKKERENMLKKVR